MSTVIADLSSDPVASTTAQDTTLLTSALSNVSEQRSVLDSSLSRLQASSTYTQTQEANVKAIQSSLVSADPTAVATELKTDETQHEALLSLVAALSKGSLFDLLQ